MASVKECCDYYLGQIDKHSYGILITDDKIKAMEVNIRKLEGDIKNTQAALDAGAAPIAGIKQNLIEWAKEIKKLQASLSGLMATKEALIRDKDGWIKKYEECKTKKYNGTGCNDSDPTVRQKCCSTQTSVSTTQSANVTTTNSTSTTSETPTGKPPTSGYADGGVIPGSGRPTGTVAPATPGIGPNTPETPPDATRMPPEGIRREVNPASDEEPEGDYYGRIPPPRVPSPAADRPVQDQNEGRDDYLRRLAEYNRLDKYRNEEMDRTFSDIANRIRNYGHNITNGPSSAAIFPPRQWIMTFRTEAPTEPVPPPPQGGSITT